MAVNRRFRLIGQEFATGAIAFDDLTDVDLTGLASGDTIRFNGADWVPSSLGTVFTDIVTATPPTTEAVTGFFEIRDFDDSDRLARLGFLSGSNLMSLVNNMRGGTINLVQTDSGGTNRTILEGGGAGSTIVRSQFNTGLFVNNTEEAFRGVANGEAILFHNNVEKLRTTATGITVTGTLGVDGVDLIDNVAMRFGNGFDVSMAFDGTDFNTNFTGATDWNLLDGIILKIFDAGNTDYMSFRHGGAQAFTEFFQTSNWNIDMSGLTGVVTFFDTTSKFEIDPQNSRVWVRDGFTLRVSDSLDTSFAEFSHDGTDFNLAFPSTGAVDFNIRNGPRLKLFDTADTDFLQLDVDNVVSGHAGLWLRQATPSVSNYALLSPGANTFLNAPSGGNVDVRINNSTRLQVNNTDITASVTLAAQSYIQHPTFTDTELDDITDAVNTAAGKIQGAEVYNSTQDVPVYAVGNADGSVWVDGAGTTVNTPV